VSSAPTGEPNGGARQPSPQPPCDEEVIASLRRLIADLGLRFPIGSKEEFVGQMAAAGTVSFLGVDYDGTSASRLVPEFFFPAAAADDFLRKTVELVASRGLVKHARPPRMRLGDGVVSQPSASPETAVVVALVRDLAEGTQGEFVRAMDVLTHALEFSRPSGSLMIWRSALHRGLLLPQGRSALEDLVEFILAREAEGDADAYSEICDCLAFISTLPDRVVPGARTADDHYPGPEVAGVD
jgi:hypothetical protein